MQILFFNFEWVQWFLVAILVLGLIKTTFISEQLK